MPATDASVLITLEPIIGVAIALNLAYLNLSKFAYITNVKAQVGARIGRLDNSVVNAVGSTLWYKQLNAMASVHTIDSGSRFNQGLWVKSPGFWGALYNVLFYWRIARVASLALTAFCIIELLLAVGYEAQTLSVLKSTSVTGKLYFEFYVSSLAMLWPIIVVCSGEFILISAGRFIDYQTKHLKDAAIAEAQTAIAETQTALNNAKPPTL